MIQRKLETYLKQAFRRFPVLTVTGPRQSGKTTLVQTCFSDLPYANLEDPQERQFASEDPVQFLQRFPMGGVIDEIQRVPELLSYLQPIIDQRGRAGQFILTGSHQIQLHAAITQSLAGRTLICQLLPLSLQELRDASLLDSRSLDELMVQGFYPRAHALQAVPREIYRSYFETYIEKDVRQLVNIKELSLFQKFMSLCAGRVGQLLNKGDLARDAGINEKTVEHWLSVLEASYAIFRLQPHHTNWSKRLVKTPKLYFYDVGLVAWLLRIHEADQLTAHPLRGALFENMIVVETIKHQFNLGLEKNVFFFRDSAGLEVDLLIELANGVFPVEIKSAATFTSDFTNGIEALSERSPQGGAIVLGGGMSQARGTIEIIPWHAFPGLLARVRM